MVVVGVMALAVLRLSDILPIIGVAVILSYLLTPMVNFFEKRLQAIPMLGSKPHRNIAVMLTYVVILTAFVVIILVVVPALARQIEEFGRRLPTLILDLERSIEQSLNEPLMFNGEPVLIDGEPLIPLQRLREVTGVQHLTQMLNIGDVNLVGTTQSFIGSLSGPAFDFVGGALTALINVIFLMTMMFFLMRDGHVFVEKGVRMIPASYQGDSRRLLYELGMVWNAYLRGQLSLALFMGVVVFSVASVLGLPNPIILGLISGLLEFIPSVGSGLAIFPAALLALTSQSSTIPSLEGASFALVTVIVWAVLQNIEVYFLVPRVMGGSLNLHPFVILIAIIAGATLAGVLGIILAAPTVASLRVFGQYIYGKLMDQDPFPAPSPRPIAPSDTRLRRAWQQAQQGLDNSVGAQVRQWLDARRKPDVG